MSYNYYIITNIIITHEAQLTLVISSRVALLVSTAVIIRIKHMVVMDLGLDLGEYQLFGGRHGQRGKRRLLALNQPSNLLLCSFIIYVN